MKLVEGVHILCSTNISPVDMQKAHDLFHAFVEEFEQIYGKKNMVFNVHLLLHTVECVNRNGPLFAYSNYSSEDYLGHLISFIKGTTDVPMQIADRYMLEKNLIKCLQSSPRALAFNERIQPSHFAVTTKINKFILIGKGKSVDKTSFQFVYELLHLSETENVIEYRAVFVNSNTYFESKTTKTEKKRTYDSFVCNMNKQLFAEIQNILLVQNKVYFVVSNDYVAVTTRNSPLSVIVQLEKKLQNDLKLVNSDIFNEKYVFLRTESISICSKFPNLYERH